MIGTTFYRPFATGEPFVIHGLEQDETVFRPIQRDHIWEPHLIAVLERIIRPGFVCMDVGANIGAITLPLARLASSGHVHAFEASANAAGLLRSNVVYNGLTNVTIVQKAIAKESGGMTDLFTVPGQLGTAHQAIEFGRDGERQQVETLALDDYGVSHVDFIKLDIEGSEIAALSGARKLIEGSLPILAIEYNPVPAAWFAGSERHSLYEVLTGLYPRIEIIGEGGTLQPVSAWAELDQALTKHVWRDLLCYSPL